jgi:KipI family sensor histidine kinase inhibitor
MNWVYYGPKALLFRFAEKADDEAFAKGCALAAEVQQARPEGMVEFVPAFTSLLVTFETPEHAAGAAEQLMRRFEKCASAPMRARKPLEIPVIYDGEDLDRVAGMHGLSPRDVGQIHAATVYKVYVLGFSPGFPYLGDLDPRLLTPRLASPRARVPAGAVAIGGAHTGIYPVETPGGWNIIGHTDVKLFDPARGDGEEMFLLKPGDRVRFVSATA